MEDGFNLTQLVELCGPTELILIRPGEFLFREGDEAQSLYVVKKGSLRIMSGSVVYETITAGGVVGEMALIDDGAPRSASRAERGSGAAGGYVGNRTHVFSCSMDRPI